MPGDPPERANTAVSMIPRMLDSLRALALAEETHADRAKLKGKVAWFGDVLRIRGSTVLDVWKAVIVVTVWATVVAVADFVYGREFNLSSSVVPLLSVVVGLMLVFRNTTAFARWDEGRKSFTALRSLVRNLARDYWISVGGPCPGQDANVVNLPQNEVRTKARCLRLMVAFVVAAKRHVRGQYGIDYEDLRALLPPEFYTQTDTLGFGYDAAEADMETEQQPHDATTPESPHQSPDLASKPVSAPIPSATNPPNQAASSAIVPRAGRSKPRLRQTSVFSSQEQEWLQADLPVLPSETSPLLRKIASDHRLEDPTTVVIHNYLSKPSLPLPLVIAHQIHLYVARCKGKGYLESVGPPGFGRLIQGVMTMTDLFGQLETLEAVKIPACYGIHLKQCTTLYLFALPLTLASDLGWMLIPSVTIVAFTLMGIEALARECEDPFGVDPSDLPLDYMCAELRNEVEHLIAKLGSNPDADIMF
ncbi:hypothetical protein CROQUDRAFT_71336 [Cronartium quercuum f. sp. fusiforme G11]|uniref:Uncharacterized protein n=1 Tax=Cronartium quercuum f. sp. fusiforme G11 TaxID=708437 RepID=A0A9P6TGQ4_9BASI|nr:hypothetical protein CROQUDRAFT_71336 [Cronartium quercuum f. sp. fusiforme G11]